MAQLVAYRFDMPIDSKLAKQRGVARRHYLSLGYPTSLYAERGFSIWDFDLRTGIRKEREALSALQTAFIPDPNTRFRDLAAAGYQINLECPYCNTKLRNSLSDPSLTRFNSLRVVTTQRPICEECGRPRVAVLHPDPRAGGLLPRMKEPQ